MSTSTNQLLDEENGAESGFLHVDGKRIVAHLVTMRNPIVQQALEFFDWISPASFWGMLRANEVDSVLVTAGDPMMFVVDFTDESEFMGYYKMSFDDYTTFYYEFCGWPGKSESINWFREGF